MVNWIEELFSVSHVLRTNPITCTLKDDVGKELCSAFYHEEKQKVGDKVLYHIETILQERFVGR